MTLNVRCSLICVAGAKDLVTALARMPQLKALTSALLWNSVGAAVAKDLDPAVDGRRLVCLGYAAPFVRHLDLKEKPYKSPARTRSSFQPEPSDTVQTKQDGLQRALLKGYTCMPASSNDADGRLAIECLHYS